MKALNLKLAAAFLLLSGLNAHAGISSVTYELTITNGGPMPLSPSVTFVSNMQEALSRSGVEPTPAFIKLCQMGDGPGRAMELASIGGVGDIAQTAGLIMPGESRTVEVRVDNPATQSIQFETMYGKTKDTCGVAVFGSHILQALNQRVTSKIQAKDNVVQTGAFLSPSLPAGDTYEMTQACSGQMAAVDCLRTLAPANPGMARIHASEPYLPSVAMFLERKFGAMETQSLLLTGSGAIQFELKLKH
jgi:hypothetical protein